MTRLTDWHDGDRLSAAHLQEAVDMLHELSSTTGAGGTEVTRFPMGTAIHTPEQNPPGIRGVFPVKVEKTGGADGGVSSPASWTYTVRRVEWTGSGTSANFELGTAVAVYKTRPSGQMQYPTGDQHFGLAFWDSSTTPPTIILWDAGEYELTSSTCT